MIEHEFMAVLLSAEGTDRSDNGLDTTGDQWHQLQPVTINLECIESYYELARPQLDAVCCNVQMHSGDVWTLATTYQNLKNIKKGIFARRSN